MINGGTCGISALVYGVRGAGKCGCVITDRGMDGVVGIRIQHVGKFLTDTVAYGVVAILKISPNFWSAICWSISNCVIVEAGCGWRSAIFISCAAGVAVSYGDNTGRR